MRTLLLTFLIASVSLFAQRGGGGSRGGGGGGFRGGSSGGFRGGSGSMHSGGGNFSSGYRGGGGYRGGVSVGAPVGSGYRGGNWSTGYRGGYSGYHGGYSGYRGGYYGGRSVYWGFGFGYPYYYGGFYSGWYPSYDYSYYADPYYYGAPTGGYYYESAPVAQQPAVVNQYYTAPTAQPRLTSTSSYYLLAMPNGTVDVATRYWMEGDTLHYVLRNGQERMMPVANLDRDLTEQLNRERGVSLQLR